jgi:hypothetical protein
MTVQAGKERKTRRQIQMEGEILSNAVAQFHFHADKAILPLLKWASKLSGFPAPRSPMSPTYSPVNSILQSILAALCRDDLRLEIDTIPRQS